MNRKEMNNSIFNDIKEIANSYKEIDSLYLFGSYANGTQKDDSDIDIAILCNNPSKHEDIIKEIAEITKKYKKFIHPVIFEKTKDILIENNYIKTNIFDNSVLLYSKK